MPRKAVHILGNFLNIFVIVFPKYKALELVKGHYNNTHFTSFNKAHTETSFL